MKNNTVLQYQGFLETPSLWNKNGILDLFQFELKPHTFQITNIESFDEIRLGKRVEQFFYFQIKNTRHLKLLASNIQVKNRKLTIGELDALILNNGQPTHIEIIYKFYLYDPNIESDSELDKWIGPNRKDTLIYKLKKLKNKQLPLLYSEHCKSILSSFNLDAKDIIQKVCYKTQLFLPFKTNDIDISPLNKACIYGFYISYSKFEKLKDFQFYIPKKLDWLVIPNYNVDWLSFVDAKQKVETFIVEKRSPMVWLKHNNKLQKCFITFW